MHRNSHKHRNKNGIEVHTHATDLLDDASFKCKRVFSHKLNPSRIGMSLSIVMELNSKGIKNASEEERYAGDCVLPATDG